MLIGPLAKGADKFLEQIRDKRIDDYPLAQEAAAQVIQDAQKHDLKLNGAIRHASLPTSLLTFGVTLGMMAFTGFSLSQQKYMGIYHTVIYSLTGMFLLLFLFGSLHMILAYFSCAAFLKKLPRRPDVKDPANHDKLEALKQEFVQATFPPSLIEKFFNLPQD